MRVHNGHLTLGLHFHSHLISLRPGLNNLEIILWATGQTSLSDNGLRKRQWDRSDKEERKSLVGETVPQMREVAQREVVTAAHSPRRVLREASRRPRVSESCENPSIVCT